MPIWSQYVLDAPVVIQCERVFLEKLGKQRLLEIVRHRRIGQHFLVWEMPMLILDRRRLWRVRACRAISSMTSTSPMWLSPRLGNDEHRTARSDQAIVDSYSHWALEENLLNLPPASN